MAQSITEQEVRKMMAENQPLNRGDFKKSFDQVVKLVQIVQADITSRMNKIEANMAQHHIDANSRIDAKLATLKHGKDGVSADHAKIVKDVLKGIRQPKDGETPIIDNQKIAEMAASLIPPLKPVDEKALSSKIMDTIQKGNTPIHISTIQGVQEYVVDVITKHSYSGGGGASVSVLQSGTLKVQTASAMNFKGSGAPTITIGSNGVTNLDFPSGGSASFVENEIVSGNGTSFTLANTPVAGSVHLYAGRNRLYPTTDYSITGTAITTVLTWTTGDLIADYRK